MKSLEKITHQYSVSIRLLNEKKKKKKNDQKWNTHLLNIESFQFISEYRLFRIKSNYSIITID